MSLVNKILEEAKEPEGPQKRTAVKITPEELEVKINDVLADEDGYLDLYTLTPTINKDIKNVEFNFENTEWREGDGFGDLPCGLKTLSNGLTVMFVNAGGDWEDPVAFCLYWDGKEVRGYVPLEGNTFDKELMMAYGNESDAPEDLKPDFKKMEEDIINNIILEK